MKRRPRLDVDAQRLVVWQEAAKIVAFHGALALFSIDHGAHDLLNAWRLIAAVQGDQRQAKLTRKIHLCLAGKVALNNFFLGSPCPAGNTPPTFHAETHPTNYVNA